MVCLKLKNACFKVQISGFVGMLHFLARSACDKAKGSRRMLADFSCVFYVFIYGLSIWLGQ